MNERIRDLAEHCDFYVGNEHSEKSHEEKQRIWVEKFAKLIVDICRDIAEDGFEEQLDGQEISDQIFEFFRG